MCKASPGINPTPLVAGDKHPGTTARNRTRDAATSEDFFLGLSSSRWGEICEALMMHLTSYCLVFSGGTYDFIAF